MTFMDEILGIFMRLQIFQSSIVMFTATKGHTTSPAHVTLHGSIKIAPHRVGIKDVKGFALSHKMFVCRRNNRVVSTGNS